MIVSYVIVYSLVTNGGKLCGRYQGASAPLQHPDNAELTGNQPNADYQVTSTSFQCPDNQRATGNFTLIIVRFRVHYQCKMPVNSALGLCKL